MGRSELAAKSLGNQRVSLPWGDRLLGKIMMAFNSEDDRWPYENGQKAGELRFVTSKGRGYQGFSEDPVVFSRFSVFYCYPETSLLPPRASFPISIMTAR